MIQRLIIIISVAISIIILTFVAVSSSFASVEYIGDFSNMRFTDEHAYGYDVQLWREKDKLFGLFYVSNGLAGDTPRGLLDEVRFDPVSGKISFSAKLSASMVLIGNGKLAPSHDFFKFEGSLDNRSLSGKLTHDELQNPQMHSVEQVKLVKTDSESPVDAASYTDWKLAVEQVLKSHGPKW